MLEIQNLNEVLQWAVLVANCIILIMLMRRYTSITDIFHSERPLKIGQQAPSFVARTISGEKWDLSKLIQNDAVLIFLSPDCSSCYRIVPSIKEDFLLASSVAHVQFFIVIERGYKEVEAAQEEWQFSMPVFADSRQRDSIGHLYNPISLTPSYCYIGKDGIVKGIGDFRDTYWNELRNSWLATKRVRDFRLKTSFSG
jgi:hypothetical protein